MPALESIGFRRTNLRELGVPAGMSGGAALFEDFRDRIDDYNEARDFPAVKGPSYLSVHLRFGTVSIRELARRACALAGARRGGAADVALRARLARFLRADPLSSPARRHHAFKPRVRAICLPERRTAQFTAWCEARTGYPLVDAAMRQINQTGYMHNRLRMIVASFLVKDLLVDWRWGERISPTS